MRFLSNIRESARFTASTLLAPCSRWAVLFLFGLPWLALSYAVDWTKIMSGTLIRWELVPWPVVAPLAVLGILGSLLMTGYTVRLFHGGITPPDFEYPGDLVLDGIRLAVIGLLWMLPLVVMLAVPLLIFRVMAPSMTGIYMMMAFLGFFIIFGLFVVLMDLVFGTIGIIRFARTGSVREAFAFSAISATISRIGFLYYVLSLLFLIIIGLLFSLFSLLLGIIPLAGPALASFISPVMAVFRCRFLTNLYDHVNTDAPAPLAEPAYAPPAHATSRGILTWALIFLVITALCAAPFLLAFGTLSPPAMTTAELAQADNDDITVRSPDGYYSSPHFSGDGSWIYYTATTRPEVAPPEGGFTAADWERDVWVMTATGKNQTRITRIGEVERIALDPVTDTVAFSRYQDNATAIILLKDHASQASRLPGPQPYMYFSSFSPDGTKIAATGFGESEINGWSISAGGSRKPAGVKDSARLFVMDRDGGNARAVANASIPMGVNGFSAETSWSPDGTQLAAPLYEPGAVSLAVIDTGTGSARTIANISLAMSSAPGLTWRREPYPRWSPKGDLIAFIRNGNVHVVRADGSMEQKIAGDGTVAALAWNPNGTRLAFSADGYLGIVDPDGGNLNRVSNIQPGPLSWSPDGNTLTYAPGIGSRIRIMKLTPGVLKMGEYMAQQMDRMKEAYATPVPQ